MPYMLPPISYIGVSFLRGDQSSNESGVAKKLGLIDRFIQWIQNKFPRITAIFFASHKAPKLDKDASSLRGKVLPLSEDIRKKCPSPKKKCPSPNTPRRETSLSEDYKKILALENGKSTEQSREALDLAIPGSYVRSGTAKDSISSSSIDEPLYEGENFDSFEDAMSLDEKVAAFEGRFVLKEKVRRILSLASRSPDEVIIEVKKLTEEEKDLLKFAEASAPYYYDKENPILETTLRGLKELEKLLEEAPVKEVAPKPAKLSILQKLSNAWSSVMGTKPREESNSFRSDRSVDPTDSSSESGDPASASDTQSLPEERSFASISPFPNRASEEVEHDLPLFSSTIEEGVQHLNDKAPIPVRKLVKENIAALAEINRVIYRVEDQDRIFSDRYEKLTPFEQDLIKMAYNKENTLENRTKLYEALWSTSYDLKDFEKRAKMHLYFDALRKLYPRIM